jgi:hypothetical protein
MIDHVEAGETFSLVDHPMSARALAAPLHRHPLEDEDGHVLESRIGPLLRAQRARRRSGNLVFKPRTSAHVLERGRWPRSETWKSSLPPVSTDSLSGLWTSAVLPARRRRSSVAAARVARSTPTRQSAPAPAERFDLRFPGEPLHRVRPRESDAQPAENRAGLNVKWRMADGETTAF